MRYLLDTNVWINYLKQTSGPILTKLQSLRSADIVTCSIVRSELLHGARRYGNRERRVSLVTQTLAPFKSFPFDDADAVYYASIPHTRRNRFINTDRLFLTIKKVISSIIFFPCTAAVVLTAWRANFDLIRSLALMLMYGPLIFGSFWIFVNAKKH